MERKAPLATATARSHPLTTDRRLSRTEMRARSFPFSSRSTSTEPRGRSGNPRTRNIRVAT